MHMLVEKIRNDEHSEPIVNLAAQLRVRMNRRWPAGLTIYESIYAHEKGKFVTTNILGSRLQRQTSPLRCAGPLA
jgi:hypothetical protein